MTCNNITAVTRRRRWWLCYKFTIAALFLIPNKNFDPFRRVSTEKLIDWLMWVNFLIFILVFSVNIFVRFTILWPSKLRQWISMPWFRIFSIFPFSWKYGKLKIFTVKISLQWLFFLHFKVLRRRRSFQVMHGLICMFFFVLLITRLYESILLSCEEIGGAKEDGQTYINLGPTSNSEAKTAFCFIFNVEKVSVREESWLSQNLYLLYDIFI